MNKRYSILTVAALAAAFTMGNPMASRACDRPDATGDYVIQFLEPPNEDCHVMFAWRNQQGLIAVQTYEGGAAVLDRGVWMPIMVESCSIGANQPNARWQVGITYADSSGPEGISRGAIYRHGQFVWMGELAGYPGCNYVVQGLNDRGLVTVTVWDPKAPQQTQYGVVLDPSFKPIRVVNCPPNTRECRPMGINNQGMIAGANVDSDQVTTAFFSDARNSYHAIQFPDYQNSAAFSINDSNDIVGFYYNEWPLHRGFILKGGRISDFYIPGSMYTAVCSINNNGQLCGVYTREGDWHAHIFVASPRHGRR
jgi:hypothetical protein